MQVWESHGGLFLFKERDMGLPEIALDDIDYQPGDALERTVAAYEALGEVKGKRLVAFMEKKYERVGIERIDEILGHLSKRIQIEADKKDVERQKAATKSKRKSRAKSKPKAEGESGEQPKAESEG
jgi:hypothetical protein